MSDIATLVPEPADTELAVSALRGLDAVLGAEGPVRLHLAGQVGDVEVPGLRWPHWRRYSTASRTARA